MANFFRRISGLIEVDHQWRPADPKVLRHPAAHETTESRVVFHETVHYWQHVGQGFLAKMAEEDWNRLQQFEFDATVSDPGPYRLEFVRRHDQADFSALDLHESLARFWDVHAIGPQRLIEMDFDDPKRQFDESFKAQYFALKQKGLIVHPEHGGYSDLAYNMAMEASAGNYAKPYLYVLEHYNPVVTATVFPLAGHFALQSERPVEAFLQMVKRVAPSLNKIPRGHSVHDLWHNYHTPIRDAAIRVSQELGYGGLTLAGAYIKNSSLREHPVYAWIFAELDRARWVLDETAFAQRLVSNYQGVPPGMAGILATDFSLACPGDTTNRSFLVEWLAPPCVRFSDGRQWLLTELHRREIMPDIDETERALSEERKHVAGNAVDIQNRWDVFLRAVRGYYA